MIHFIEYDSDDQRLSDLYNATESKSRHSVLQGG